MQGSQFEQDDLDKYDVQSRYSRYSVGVVENMRTHQPTLKLDKSHEMELSVPSLHNF